MNNIIPSNSTKMTFLEHLDELRKRLFISLIALVLGFILSWTLREQIFQFITRPIMQALAKHGIFSLVVLDAAEAIMVYLKLSLAGAVFVGMPVFLYQLWKFVKPGLMPYELRAARRMAILSLFLFVIGALFCWKFVLSIVINFLTGFTISRPEIGFQLRMESAYSTALLLMLGFGIIFELPLVMALLSLTPLFSWRKYIRWYKYFVIASFAIAALLTPPDMVSQILMALPLSVLYLIGVLLSFIVEKGGKARSHHSTTGGVDAPLLAFCACATVAIYLLCTPTKRRPEDFIRFVPASVASIPPGHTNSRRLCPDVLQEAMEFADSVASRIWCISYVDAAPILIFKVADQDIDRICARFRDSTGKHGTLHCQNDGDFVVLGRPVSVTASLVRSDSARLRSFNLALPDQGYPAIEFFFPDANQDVTGRLVAVIKRLEDSETQQRSRFALTYYDPSSGRVSQVDRYASVLKGELGDPSADCSDLAKRETNLLRSVQEAMSALSGEQNLSEEARHKLSRALASLGRAYREVTTGLQTYVGSTKFVHNALLLAWCEFGPPTSISKSSNMVTVVFDEVDVIEAITLLSHLQQRFSVLEQDFE